MIPEFWSERRRFDDVSRRLFGARGLRVVKGLINLSSLKMTSPRSPGYFSFPGLKPAYFFRGNRRAR